MNPDNLGSKYWLTTWLDAHRIKTVSDARTLLSNKKILNELHDVSGQWSAVAERPPVGTHLTAGTGLRLDDLLTCPNPQCRKQQVDVLFRHAWHYFDYILLPDGVGDLVRHRPEAWTRDQYLEMLLNMIDIALHIQQIGGSPLVWYYPKPDNVSEAIDESVDQFGEAAWNNAWKNVEDTLLSKGQFQYKALRDGKLRVGFSDPMLGVGTSVLFRFKKRERRNYDALRAAVAHEVLHEHIACLEQDLAVSRLLGGTLGSNVWSHERVLMESGGLRTHELALRLSLPGLSNVPIGELIAFRLTERDAFNTFRAALTRAGTELLKDRDNSKPTDIVQDIIEPELARIRRRLRTAERALARKTTFSIVLGAIGVTCGVLYGSSLSGFAGLGVLLPGIAAAGAKYLDEKQAVEMSDMFFLWKALEHAEKYAAG